MKQTMRQRGFTLLEIIVATALAGAVVGALAVSLFTGFRMQRSAEAVTQWARQGQSVMVMLERDVWCAVRPTGVLAGAFVGTDEREGMNDADRMTFFTTSDPLRSEAGGSDLMQVSYRVMRVGEIEMAGSSLGALREQTLKADQRIDEKVLVRETVRQLLATEAQVPMRQVLVRGVERFNLRYYDGFQWVETWDSTTRENELPGAVEMTLGLETGAKETGKGEAGSGRVLRYVVRSAAATVDVSGGLVGALP